MYFPVSALLIEYLILTIVSTQDSYGYEISQTVKLAADHQRIHPVPHPEKAGKIRFSHYLFTGISGAEAKILLHHA